MKSVNYRIPQRTWSGNMPGLRLTSLSSLWLHIRVILSRTTSNWYIVICLPGLLVGQMWVTLFYSEQLQFSQYEACGVALPWHRTCILPVQNFLHLPISMLPQVAPIYYIQEKRNIHFDYIQLGTFFNQARKSENFILLAAIYGSVNSKHTHPLPIPGHFLAKGCLCC